MGVQSDSSCSKLEEGFGLEASATHSEGIIHTASLADLGLQQQTKRHIGPVDIICVGWNICNSWIAVATTLALSIALGGSVTVIYGIIVIFIFIGCSVLTLAELASVYPTAGGQYHWTSILTPERYSRGASYICGILNVFAWIATSAGIAIIIANLLLAMVIFYHDSYTPQPWHYFLVYQAVNVFVILHNIFTLRKTMWTNDISFALTLTGFFVVIITCVARASTKQSNEAVWTYFVNGSGWENDGIVFLTGLVSPNYMYAGIDGAIHLAEECANAAVAVPRALMSTWLIGFTTSFAFAVATTYCIADFESVLNSSTGVPIYEIWTQATRSDTAATVFMAILLTAAIVALIAVEQTSSRLTWAFARDNAVLGSAYLSKISTTLEVPVWSLLANGVIIFIIGCIYLGSSTAFNAFIGTGLILQQVTYAIPAFILLCRKRSRAFLPADRPFKLPALVGWVANVLTIVFAIIVVVFYDFPVVMPVTPSNMNYTSAVIGGVGLFAVFNWFVWARHHYRGPRLQAV